MFGILREWRLLCVFCGQADVAGRICSRCIGVLPRNDLYCDCCGQPVSTHLSSGTVCAHCQKRTPLFTKARAPFLYAFPIDSALKALKFRRQLQYAPGFADLVLPTLTEDFPDVDVLVPVPLHRWRHARRGFNQADEICHTISKRSGLAISKNVVRIRRTPTQAGLSAAKRQKNLRGAFKASCSFKGSYPLIFDDVITTGATCEQLAHALLAAGASRVGVLTVARA